MDFEKKAPEWTAEGTEPPASLKASGFEAGYKPPAAYFNWFWYRVCECLTELQTKLRSVFAVSDGGTGKTSVASGNYLVGDGTNALIEKTPAEVREHIGAAPANAAIPTVSATSEDGIAYAATVPGVTELYNGLMLTIIPETRSSSPAITLDVNGLGAKMVRLPLSFNTAAMSAPKLETYYTEGRPITLQYDANYTTGGAWKTFGKQKTSAQDLYGRVPVEGGGTGAETAEEARANLGAAATIAASVIVPMTGWPTEEPYTQEIAVSGVTSDTATCHVVMSFTPGYREAFTEYGVQIIEQGDGIVTMQADAVPEAEFPVNVLIINQGVPEE